MIYIYTYIHTVDREYVRVPRGVELAKAPNGKRQNSRVLTKFEHAAQVE